MKTKPTAEAIEKAAQNYADSLTFNSAYIDADKRDELKASAREDYTAGFKSAIDQMERQPVSTGERLSACEMYKKHFGLSKKEFFIPSDAGSLEVVDVMKAFAAQEVEAANGALKEIQWDLNERRQGIPLARTLRRIQAIIDKALPPAPKKGENDEN